MDVPVLMMDYSMHCIKSNSRSGGYECICDSDTLPASITNKQLAQERRETSFLGLLRAILNDLRITSASFLGTSVARDLMDNDKPVSELCSILGPDVPVKAFLHTSPLFNLVQTCLSQEHSWELLRLIRHMAPVLHLADAKWSAEKTYEKLIALPSIDSRKFVWKVYDTTASRSRPLLTKEEGKKKEYDSQPEGTHQRILLFCECGTLLSC